jgi:Xaa-Pro aminopeptidase
VSETRLQEVKRFVRRYRLSHILISDVTQVQYISGFQSSNAFLLISARTSILFTDFRYQSVAAQFCRKNPLWRFVAIKSKDYSFLRPFLKNRSRVGIQSDSVTLDALDQMKKQLSGVRFIKLRDALSYIPAVKLRHEITAMRRAAAIGDKAFSALLSEVKIGMTEKEAAGRLEELCRMHGSERPSFETIVLFGARAALPHGRPTNRRLRYGDWILCDFGCTVKGFYSDMTRTAVMGKANRRQKNLYALILNAQKQAKKAIRPGVKACFVDSKARSIIEEAGYGELFGHPTGHGLGLIVHEKPSINKNIKTVLAENMVFTIEPGVYINGFGGVRIEDMMIVTKNGARSLTKSPRELLEI